jgi:hypothetical protein
MRPAASDAVLNPLPNHTFILGELLKNCYNVRRVQLPDWRICKMSRANQILYLLSCSAMHIDLALPFLSHCKIARRKVLGGINNRIGAPTQTFPRLKRNSSCKYDRPRQSYSLERVNPDAGHRIKDAIAPKQNLRNINKAKRLRRLLNVYFNT